MAGFLVAAASALAQSPDRLITAGDGIVTGFPGITTHVPPGQPPGEPRFRFIDTKAASARVRRLARPGYIWDGRAWNAPQALAVPAEKIGLVFGVALDDEGNAYLTAGSTWGLHVVAPAADGDGRLVRLNAGAAQARFMPGQWGEGGGPGSVWRVDARTGEVTLFADIRLNGKPNSGPALGNIAFDASHRQLFVSDRDTGMIHRLDMTGRELEVYDHGVVGRQAASLAPVPFDPANRLDIRSAAFDATDPASWAYAAPQRRVWGLAVNGGRLYYAVARSRAAGRAEVWSVALDERTGAFTGDIRRELELPADASRDEVADIAFTRNGAMILAQRAAPNDPFAMKRFTRANRARVLRYWPEVPDDPRTPSHWIAEPEEYAIGLAPPHRATAGGIALGYGYDREGVINRKVCDGALWSTGDSLRPLPDPAGRSGVVRALHGVQGAPARPVRPFNTPPLASYMVDFDNRPGTPGEAGWMGDVEIFAPGCNGAPGPVAGNGVGATAEQGATPASEGPFTPWDYPPTPDWTYPPEIVLLPCALAPGGCGIPAPTPEFEVQKTCGICRPGEDGGFACSCTITLTHNGMTFDGPFTISEHLSGGGTITGISADDGWMCTPLPNANPACSITADALPDEGGTTSIKVDIAFDSVEELDKAKNCASGGLKGGVPLPASCAGFAAVKVEKKLAGDGPDGGHCGFGTACSYQITVTNLSATNPYNGPVTVVDNLTGGTMTITSVTPAMCSPEPATAPFACIANVNLPPGGSITWTISGMLTPAEYGPQNVEVKNCGSAALPPASTDGAWWEAYLEEAPSDASCVSQNVCAFSCHMSNTEGLTVKKELKSDACEPGGQCTYTITMANNGGTPRSGPFSIREYLPAGATYVSVAPAPWTCAPDASSSLNDVVCKYPPGMPLAAGDTLSFDIVVAIPAGFEGEEIRNCAGFDVAGSGETPASMRKKLARLPGFGDRAGRLSPNALMAAYLKSRGMSEEASRKAVRRMFARAAESGDAVSGEGRSCVSTPVSDDATRKPAPRAAPVAVPVPAKPRTQPRPHLQPKPRSQPKPHATPRQQPARCVKPAFPTRRGTCACPRGWRQVSPTRCRKVVIEKPRLNCVKPAFPVNGGRACACPRGWRKVSPTRCLPKISRPKPREEKPVKGKPGRAEPARPLPGLPGPHAKP